MVAYTRLIKWFIFIGICSSAVQIMMICIYEFTHVQIYSDESLFRLHSAYNHQSTIGKKLSITDVSKSLRNSSDSGKKNPDVKILKISSDHEGHNGYALATSVRNSCISIHYPLLASQIKKDLHVLRSTRLVYCPMEKIGTTFWRRAFYMKSAKNGSKYSHPFEVPIATALESKKLFNIKMSSTTPKFIRNWFTFLFVRNPYSRLLSAFIDKLVAPNPYFWTHFGAKSISSFRKMRSATIKTLKNARPVLLNRHMQRKTTRRTSKLRRYGHDVTFQEFVKYVVSSEAKGKNVDPHVISIFRSCKPCRISYSYVGRMESFQEDALFIMKQMGINTSIDAMRNNFHELSVEDAINDTIYSPFMWKMEIIKIISWEKALKRIWLKLQLRGIIGLSQGFPLSDRQIALISAKEFINIAQDVHAKSNSIELKEQKLKVKKEAFASVNLEDLKAFRETFMQDFELFGYDPSPAYIFNRSGASIQQSLFNYSHLN